ncbi:coiled-coil domain-containing protein 191 isoform X2 [Alosa pseudoharengus]|uniref:coiled-coil domain-containing protein 191 isoform X2 n=1 Tax=Alosa pseudoharengus TaxID=34774 RepID=UPI003F8C48D4
MKDGHRADLFRWKKITQSKKPSTTKVQRDSHDIDHWIKRVEKASEFAVSEVFSLKKSKTGIHHQAISLQSTDQLQDHDEAYGEAQAILSEWMNQKLRLELEMDDEEEEEEITINKIGAPVLRSQNHPTVPQYNSFNDMYANLEQEEESFVVNNILQELMVHDVLDPGIVEDLSLDSADRAKRRTRNPGLTMEVRHRQVKENRLRRDVERERERREREAQREVREEAQRRVREEEMRRQQEVRRKDELLQQEVVRLRREMEERRAVEQLARRMEKEREYKEAKQRETRSIKPAVLALNSQKQQDEEQLVQEQVEARVHMLNLQCLQKHFSAWFTLVLARRLRQGKAAALCDWRRKLRVWRAWRALVWANKEEREAERTEEELRLEHRRCQVAAESDRKRLLRRCLNDWQLWCRMERERRELLQQQEETKRKMAALISAAVSGKLGSEHASVQPVTDLPEKSSQSEPIDTKAAIPASQCPGTTPASASPLIATEFARGDARGDACGGGGGSLPKQAWQVTRGHGALSVAELQQLARRRKGLQEGQLADAPRRPGVEVRGGRFEHRHATQQQVITEQRRLLREQQEVIARLQETRSMAELQQRATDAQTRATAQTPAGPRLPITQLNGFQQPPKNLKGSSEPITEKRETDDARPQGISGKTNMSNVALRNPQRKSTALHPTVQAMEERARQRAERRKEVEERKRQIEEERLAQLKAAEEERQRVEEEEKRIATEKKREERRKERERELEKQRKQEREQKLLHQAKEHYQRSLLLRQGLAPWKRLMEQCHANTQLATAHHGHWALRRCFLLWHSASQQRQANREACAAHLHRNILLRRSLASWKRLKDYRSFLEARAQRFCRERVLRRVFMVLLDYVTDERLAAWDREQLAQEHHTRRVVRSCFLNWRRLPELQREEKEREVRREQLRRKVAEILPDFRASSRDSIRSSVLPPL